MAQIFINRIYPVILYRKINLSLVFCLLEMISPPKLMMGLNEFLLTDLRILNRKLKRSSEKCSIVNSKRGIENENLFRNMVSLTGTFKRPSQFMWYIFSRFLEWKDKSDPVQGLEQLCSKKFLDEFKMNLRREEKLKKRMKNLSAKLAQGCTKYSDLSSWKMKKLWIRFYSKNHINWFWTVIDRFLLSLCG